MFCPKCSQQQISDNIRFCSRCGFQLNVVKALLADNETALTQNSGAVVPGNSLRKKDMIIGVLLMFFFALHNAWTTEDLSLEGKFTGLIINCLILSALINAILTIRNFFRRRATQDRPSSPKILSNLTARFKDNTQKSALPHARSRPATDYVTGGINTAEIVAPPSVTEKTTSLLNSNQE